jgi:outer membrane protein assembly factor BamD
MKQAYKYLLLIFVILVLTACGATKVKPKNSAEKYFQEGERYFEGKLYEDAIASWEKVRDTFYSPELSMLAEMKIAETYYVSERYSEAASAFSDFLANHPNDPRAGIILYRLGLCYYNQILSADRDQTNTENALVTFQQLVQRFPNNPNAQEARNLIQRCKTRLAEHEVVVSSYYLKKEKFEAAIKRLEQLLNDFPEYYYRDEAFFYLGKAYLKTEQKEKAQLIFQQLFEQFPGSDYVNDAREMLEEGK